MNREILNYGNPFWRFWWRIARAANNRKSTVFFIAYKWMEYLRSVRCRRLLFFLLVPRTIFRFFRQIHQMCEASTWELRESGAYWGGIWGVIHEYKHLWHFTVFEAATAGGGDCDRYVYITQCVWQPFVWTVFPHTRKFPNFNETYVRLIPLLYGHNHSIGDIIS